MIDENGLYGKELEKITSVQQGSLAKRNTRYSIRWVILFFFVKVVFRCSSVPGVLKTPKKPNPDFSIYLAGVTLNELGVLK